MPYPADHRERTRVRILASAQALFNRRGFEGVSIDEVMANAGLTHGGFYSYFRSKTELYAEVVSLGLETVARLRQIEPLDRPSAERADVEAAQRIARAYLSRQHFDDLDGSCPLAALPGDVRRSDPAVKQAFESVFKSVADVFERGLIGTGRPDPARAIAIAILCVGGMVVARSVNDSAFADDLRHAALSAAFHLGRLSPPSDAHAVEPAESSDGKQASIAGQKSV